MAESERDWSIETEGRVACLLRELARLESDDERRPVIEELRLLTGVDLGEALSRWLAWYLEDHLGMRNAVGILTGRQVSEERVENVLGDDEQVFERAEYNWCALERVKSKDDMVKLRMLYIDLESPLRTEADGPFSFRRIGNVDEDTVGYFEGKTLTEAVFNPAVEQRHLRILKDYGKTMMMPVFPSPTQRTGAVLYAAAISQALVKFDAKITSLSYKDLSESLPGLLDRPYIVNRYADLFKSALEKCA